MSWVQVPSPALDRSLEANPLGFFRSLRQRHRGTKDRGQRRVEDARFCALVISSSRRVTQGGMSDRKIDSAAPFVSGGKQGVWVLRKRSFLIHYGPFHLRRRRFVSLCSFPYPGPLSPVQPSSSVLCPLSSVLCGSGERAKGRGFLPSVGRLEYIAFFVPACGVLHGRAGPDERTVGRR